MRTRLALVLATAAAAAATALPAHASAAIYPFCAGRLTDAATGDNSYCYTQGPGALGNRNVAVRRTSTIQVQAGAVDATLWCDGYVQDSATVSGPAPVELNAWGGNSCYTRMVAREDHTTAVSESHFTFVIILD